MSYFSPTKGDRPVKPAETAAPEVKAAAPLRTTEREIVSTLGAGLLITGNIVSTGGVQVFGRVVGDIHAAHLVVGKGANIEGNVRAQDVVIDGTFKGTIHGNVVKLQSTAAVEGEVYNRSLAIDQNANFEGVARRLSQPVEAPTEDQIAVKPATPALVPEQPAATAYAYTNGGYASGNGYAANDANTNGAAPNGQASTY
ncbi:MAG TPA: polymer-forming cytoskeletal protein [Pseudolabrys sp.]|nr:polymer-forming cytoskeletal protein [Pseudolabrys sp.]